MTEKRFELKWRDTGEVLYDNETGLEHKIYSPDYRFHVRDMMNELNEIHLKLKHRHSLLHDICIDLEAERDRLQNDVNFLEKENKELKQQLESEHTMLDNAILLERTRMGKNSLIQYRDAIQ